MAKLNVGDKMPNFTFNTQKRDGVTIEEAVKGKKKTVFWVLRYIGCTVCRYDVHVLSQRYQEFLDKDAQVLWSCRATPRWSARIWRVLPSLCLWRSSATPI